METKTGRKEKGPGRPVKIAALVISLLCLLSALVPTVQEAWKSLYRLAGLAETPQSGFTVHFLDVGSADAALLCFDGSAVLVDSGTYDSGREIVRYLHRMEIQNLALAVNTHPDNDHLGGMAEVIENFPPAQFWESEIPEELIPDTEEYRLLRTCLNEKKIPVEKVSAGKRFSFGPAEIEVLGPTQPGSTSNNNSLILMITCYGKRLLMMGDAEEEEEEQVLGESLNCDVLKVGHHGSNTSTGRKLLKWTSPEYAVISAGERQPANEKVLQRLEENEIQVFQTNEVGTVVLTIQESGLSFFTLNHNDLSS